MRSEALSAAALNWAPVANTNIIATIATNSMTGGAITFYCEWRALSAAASLQGAYVRPTDD